MFCRECGKQVADDAKFCDECGAAQVTVSVKATKTVSDTTIQGCPSCYYKGWTLGEQCKCCGYVAGTKKLNLTTAPTVYKFKHSTANSNVVPVNITFAILLQWVSLLIGLLRFPSAYFAESHTFVFVLIFLVWITFWVTAKLNAGKSWMRLFLLISSVLGFFIALNTNNASGGHRDGADVIGWVFTIVILILLYSPSASVYFKAKSNN